MRIGVCVRDLDERTLTEAGLYTWNVLRAMSRVDPVNEYVLYPVSPLMHRIEAANFKESPFPFSGAWSRWVFFFKSLFGQGCDRLILTPDQDLPPFGSRAIVLAHGLTGRSAPGPLGPSVRRADRVVVLSDGVRADLAGTHRVPESRIEMVGLGYDDEAFRLCHDGHRIRAIRDRYGLKGPYFIGAGGAFRDRGSLTLLIEAFLKARTRSRGGDVRLVMSGEAGKDREELQAIFSRSDLQGAAVRVGDIPMEDMSVLLGAAEGMIFAASDGEFGYPIVQAMACGCPVIVTRPPVVDGVAGDAVLQAEATNTEDIARKMGTLLMDAHIQKEMRRRGFARSAGSSWNDIARRILKILGA